MAFMERIEPAVDEGDLVVIRLLRHYAALRDQEDDGRRLSSLVALGQDLRVPPEGSVALASVFQLTEAILGRRLITACRCARALSRDERAVLRLLNADLPIASGSGTPDIPHGLPGALIWAVLSVRRLCRDLCPPSSHAFSVGDPGCPFSRAATVEPT